MGMARDHRLRELKADVAFKGRHFTAEVILWAVRWYLMFPISYRDLELMLQDRGVSVDHTTVFRWIQAYALDLENRARPYLALLWHFHSSLCRTMVSRHLGHRSRMRAAR
ncbi:hypothetical protein GCM10011504_58340 [Siccirubricoccus deserti]|nr:hypothetical protein GCM10011504_58340 [Siccirubricoccus deserti]